MSPRDFREDAENWLSAEVACCRRVVDLAASSPGDPASRDALLWVINKPNKGDMGAYGDEFAGRGRYSSAITATTPRRSASA